MILIVSANDTLTTNYSLLRFTKAEDTFNCVPYRNDRVSKRAKAKARKADSPLWCRQTSGKKKSNQEDPMEDVKRRPGVIGRMMGIVESAVGNLKLK